MKRSKIRKLTVIQSTRITPNMQRISLGGDDLLDFPENQDGAYIKFNFPPANQESLILVDGKLLTLTQQKPLVRTYTIRKQDLNMHEIEVDFVLHDSHAGPASAWAAQVIPGDDIYISGPGPKKELNLNADWFFIVGDMSAMPAISALLKTLPPTAKGYLVLEVTEQADCQDFPLPDNIQLHWIINSNHPKQADVLVETVKTLDFLAGAPYVWVACEFSSMKDLRRYFKIDRQIDKSAIYISSYWKKGLSEDKHKIVKRNDLES